MSTLSLVFLVFWVGKLLSRSCEFERITRLELIILPLYSIMMFLGTIRWSEGEIFEIIVLMLVASIIGGIQSLGVEIKSGSKEKESNVTIIMVKKNIQYIIGWVMIFVLTTLIRVHYNLSSIDIKGEIISEVMKEMIPIIRFSSKDNWEIWLISAFSSLNFTYLLQRKDIRIRKLLMGKQSIK